MEKFALDFQKKHPGIRVEEEVSSDIFEDDEGNEEEVETTTYDVTTIPNLEGLTPVSYTHLDVYKRQSVGAPTRCRCTWRFFTTIFPAATAPRLPWLRCWPSVPWSRWY